MSDKFEEEIVRAREIGVEIGAKTTNALKELQNPTKSIAVVGPFQVGKTTLLNRVFLKDDSPLKEGDGRCTTAITTRIVYGESKRATVFYRDSKIQPQVFEKNEFDSEALEKLTTVDDKDETVRQERRLELARSIRYVQIESPYEALKGTVFYDTPGIDDPNRELVDLTTIEFLGSVDLVVLIVDANRTLDAYTREFISKSVFQQGLTRAVVLASYNPKFAKTSEERAQILEEIRGQLAAIGREYVPVYAYSFDKEIDGDILRGAEEIRATVQEFAEKNTRLAREERVAFYLCEDAVRTIEKCRAVLMANVQNEEERRLLKEKIEAAIRRMDADYQNSLNAFATRFASIKRETLEQIDSDLLDENRADSQLVRFLSLFSDCESLRDVRARLDSAIRETQVDLEYYFGQLSNTIREKVANVLREASQEAAQASQSATLTFGWRDNFNVGWGGKINPTLARIAEIALGFGFFNIWGAAIVALAQFVPVLKNLLPSNWLKASVLASLKKSFVSNVESAKSNVEIQLDQARPAFEEGIREVYQDAYDVKIKPYKERFETENPPLNDAEIQALNEQISACENLIEELEQ